jgi:hypothetical protein
MHKRSLILTIFVVLSAVVAQSALANGESKNQLPFTRQATAVPNDTSDVVSRYLAGHQSSSGIQGEAKNELPFTQQVTDAGTVPSTHGGFDWTLVIGIVAAAAAIGAGAGAALRLRHRGTRHGVPQTA